jgi:hypothetical protein
MLTETPGRWRGHLDTVLQLIVRLANALETLVTQRWSARRLVARLRRLQRRRR